MLEPKFYRFACAEARGYPHMRFMHTQRLRGEAGSSPKATNKALAEYFERAIRGENPVIDSEPLVELVVDIENKGSKWPDVMGHGNAGYKFIFSERVMAAMEREGITGYSAKPARIGNISSKKLRDVEPPRYYGVLPTGSITIVKKYYREGEGGYEYVGEVHDGEDRTYSRPADRLSARFVPLAETWDGSDWFLMGNRGHFRHYCCSRKLAELAYREKWTNCEITPMDAFYLDRGADIPLPSTGKLPAAWYSAQHPQD